MNIINAKDIKQPHITALIYGTPGMGKTTLLGSLPGRTLIVDIDKGTCVLAGKENIDILSFSGNFRELEEISRQFRQTCHYDNICIDTLSELERYMLNIKAAKSSTGIPQINDYGIVNNYLLKLCRDFREINANIFFTAWEQYTDIFTPS